MKTKDALFAGVEAVLWFSFASYALYAIKNPVNIYISALVLVALAYTAALACPIFRHTSAFKEVFKKGK